jgi:hypothetical protein
MTQISRNLYIRPQQRVRGLGLCVGAFDHTTQSIQNWAYDAAHICVMNVTFTLETLNWLQLTDIDFAFAAIDVDHFPDCDTAVDFCLVLRRFHPLCRVILLSSEVAKDDFGPERRPIADATLKKPITQNRFTDVLIETGVMPVTSNELHVPYEWALSELIDSKDFMSQASTKRHFG